MIEYTLSSLIYSLSSPYIIPSLLPRFMARTPPVFYYLQPPYNSLLCSSAGPLAFSFFLLSPRLVSFIDYRSSHHILCTLLSLCYYAPSSGSYRVVQRPPGTNQVPRGRRYIPGPAPDTDIPMVEESVEVLEYIGFVANTASLIYDRYLNRPDPLQNPDDLRSMFLATLPHSNPHDTKHEPQRSTPGGWT
ncbi:hypothetical protein BDW59DRAFT_13422 [Aspergillus cavernicola]|uniref:Uncharacterized protein n=1 Tax=Aspergillus cavernicola TaxID=176166 RepID=A0ABR4HKE0_9EURO